MIGWFKTLQGRLTLLVLFAIVLAQVISLTVIVPQREDLENSNRQRTFFREAIELYRLFDETPGADRFTLAVQAGQRGSFYWMAPQSSVPLGTAADLDEFSEVAGPLRRLGALDVQIRNYADPRPLIQRYLPSPQPPQAPVDAGGELGMLAPPPPNAVGQGFRNRPPPPSDGGGWPPPPGAGQGRPPPPGIQGPGPRDWTRVGPPPVPGFENNALWSLPGIPQVAEAPIQWRLAIQMPDGLWINGALVYTPGGPPWLTAMIGQAGITAGLMVVLVVVAVGLATRRLKALTVHADRLGRGEDTDPLAEAGPTEIRQVVRAFNTMNVRLRRFIESRTRMLGAISHDLRTPITALRIRAEFIEDEENRERMLATLEEMKHLTESTLALAKEDSVSEATKTVDLTALVESIEDDLTDAGQDVSCTAEAGVLLACRPHSLKRALRNLAENGVKYGKRARVAMTTDKDVVTFIIDDDGPGIPEEKRDQVFMPFVRLEESRSKETGGVGLGLAICRSIIHSHGGDLKMDNRPEGGLRVTVRLPRNGSELAEQSLAAA